MKDDAPLPDAVPHKRRQVETLLDRHIAMWLASPDITPSERRRLQAEKDRRKALTPEDRVVVLVGREGMTPQQRARMAELVAGATSVAKGCSPDVVKTADRVVATPKETQEPVRKDTGVWAMIRYAKHRRLPVSVIMPDGSTN